MPIDEQAIGTPLKIRTEYYLKQLKLEKTIAKAFQAEHIDGLDKACGRYIIFDLSRSYWHDLGTLLWLIAVLHKLRIQGNDIQLIFPEPTDSKGEKLWDFLLRWQFFHALSLCVDQPANLLSRKQLSHLDRVSQYRHAKGTDQFGDETVLHTLRILEISTFSAEEKDPEQVEKQQRQFDKLEGQVIVGALSQMCGWDNQVTRTFMQRVLREGIRNSLLHAKGSFVNLSMRLDAKNLTLAISDNGAGIPRVLRAAFQESGARKKLLKYSDADLIKYFTEPEMILDSKLIRISTEKGVSSESERAGVGLYYLKSHVLKQKGELRIRAGKACVDFTSRKTDANDALLESPGTLLRIQTPLENVSNA